MKNLIKNILALIGLCTVGTGTFIGCLALAGRKSSNTESTEINED